MRQRCILEKVMSRMKLSHVALLLVFIPMASYGADLGKLNQKNPETIFKSKKSIFDIERCIIELDAPGLPSVYRQPDRPKISKIAYEQGVGVIFLITLTESESETKIEVRRGILGFRKVPLPNGFEACL